MPETTRGYPYPAGTAIPDVPADMQALARAIDTDVGVTRSAVDQRLRRGPLPVDASKNTGVTITSSVVELVTVPAVAITLAGGLVLISASAALRSPATGGGPVRVWVQSRKDGGAWAAAYEVTAGSSEMNQTGGAWTHYAHVRTSWRGPGSYEHRLVAQVQSGGNWNADNSWLGVHLLGESS